ncbi:flagellum-specific peptidoglycan hydrolase FlgJ [Novosphingobium sp. PhB55]|uniref:peptidoglycan-binding protein n=1 Tax=Novosphingobium sp. PhB55 TaxID=2485106 RepID=UPI001066D662|nr:peptidoglycan-binding protein [Novosphingobium sp. PhB55]TDW64607.1 flagellum-specific peptidoglycan hydrolase FlgJ [Novosphingobium sp. PhB55]
MSKVMHDYDPIGLELPFAPVPAGNRQAGENIFSGQEAGPYNFDEALLENETGTPHSFNNCSAQERTLLTDAAERSLTSLRHAASFVGSAYGRPDRMSPATRQLLLDHFHTVRRDDLRKILTNLMRIAKAFVGGIRFNAARACKADANGMVCGFAYDTQLFGGRGYVNVCFDARTNHCNFPMRSSDAQEQIVIHEVAHRYVGIGDQAYHHEAAYARLLPAKALDNADSYAFFATEARATLSEAPEIFESAWHPAGGTSTEWTEAALGEQEPFIAPKNENETEELDWLDFKGVRDEQFADEFGSLAADESEWEEERAGPCHCGSRHATELMGEESSDPELFETLELTDHEGSGVTDRLRDAAAFLLGPVLRHGDQGEGVNALQRALRSLGHPIDVDGRFGQQTEAAVRRFQTTARLTPDGMVGPQTKAAIAAALGGSIPNGPVPVPPGPSPVPPTPQDSSTIDDFSRALATEWSRSSGGRVDAETKRLALIADHAATLEGARARYGGKVTESAVTQAWKISRDQQMRFETRGSSGIAALGPFAPPAAMVALAADPAIGGSNLAPVAPATSRFVAELKRRIPRVSVSTYRRHGSQGFVDRGYSVDLFIPGRDGRGFYRADDALALLRAVDVAAKAAGANWRAIYNDFGVADTINREFGRRHVIFVGSPSRSKGRGTNLNWHGPNPLILHVHIDLAVAAGIDSEWENDTEFESAGEGLIEPSWHAHESMSGAFESALLPAFRTMIDNESAGNSAVGDRLKGTAEFLLGAPLRPGSAGPAVAALQRALVKLGHDLAIDGAFGPNTDRAVRSFQERARLTVDGIVGPATKAALAKALGESPQPLPLPPSSTPGPVPSNVGTYKLSPQQFVTMFAPAACASEAIHRVPSLVTLGQAALESGWAERAPRYNFFGIKAHASDPEETRQLLRTVEYLPHRNAVFPEVISITELPNGQFKYIVRDWFRAYSSAEASFDDHGRLLSTAKRYAGAFEHLNDPFAFVAEVARAGYATGPSYTSTVHAVMRMIEKIGIS